jgi:hypothetical protein
VKRLIEEDLRDDGPERWLAELVGATPRLADASPEKDRILARVLKQVDGATAAAGGWIAETRWLWGSAAAITLAGAVMAMAAATSLGSSADRDAVSTPPRDIPSSGARQESPPSPPVAVARPEAPAIAPAASAPAASHGTSADADHRAPEAEDATPVLEAIHALRTQRDADRANALLSKYLRAHPNGVLAEDALALSVESAIARHDDGAAAEWAHRYLTRFPHGRYRSFAAGAAQR